MKLYLNFLLVFFTAGIMYAQTDLPNITLNNLNGDVFDVSEITPSNGIIIYSFWATWCVPCINELDAINDVYFDWQEEVDFELIAVSIDDARTVSRVKPMVNAKLWEYEVLFDTNQDFKRFLHIESVPYLIMVKNGKIVYKHSGYSKGTEIHLFEKMKALQTN